MTDGNYQHIFRPQREPERTLYNAFQAEAEKRCDRTTKQWFTEEVRAVWEAARDYAQAYGLRVPSFDEVILAESSARGHSDYGAKWALYVAEYMRKIES